MGRRPPNHKAIEGVYVARFGNEEVLNDLFKELVIHKPPVPDYLTEDDSSYYLVSKDVFNLDWRARIEKVRKLDDLNRKVQAPGIQGKDGNGNWTMTMGMT